MEINNLLVIGGGLMGRQIGLNAAMHGVDTVVYDINGACLDDVNKWEDEYLQGRIAKGRKTPEEVAEIKKLFRTEANLEKACEGRDLIIEAILEREDLKHNLFKQLDGIIGPKTIVATNSSAMPSSLFKDDFKDPSRLCNAHFYNPALVLEFVEVVQGPHTNPEVAQAVYDFCVKTGKTPILMKKEIEKFAANFILSGVYEKARYLVENGYLTPQEADLACEKGLGHPMGPFRLNDLTGIDLTYDMQKRQYEKTGVKPLMFDIHEKMFKEGKLGKKSGEGFYKYDK